VSDKTTLERFQACAAEILSIDAAKVVPEASFADDLDADSLDIVELVMALEEEFDIEVDVDAELAEVTMVGQALALVESKLS
jgi:acyl carrier protein